MDELLYFSDEVITETQCKVCGQFYEPIGGDEDICPHCGENQAYR